MSTARILIVEDEANIRRFVRIALQDEGFQVFEADSVKRGLIHAASRQPDLVIVDLGFDDFIRATELAHVGSTGIVEHGDMGLGHGHGVGNFAEA